MNLKKFPIERIAKECIEGEVQISEVAVDQDELDYLEEMPIRVLMA